MSDVTNHKPNGKRLSALAQLVRLLMRSGLTTTADLVAETGYSERAIWKAKSELRDTEAGCMVQPSALKPSAEWVQRSAVNGAAECRSQQSETRARAYKESPSGIYISPKCSEVVRERTDCAALPDRSTVEKACRDAAGPALNCFAHGLHDISPIIGLLEGGADLDRDVVPAIRSKAATIRGGSISSWNFFVPVVSQAMAARKSASAMASKAKAARSDVDSYAKANGWRFETRPDGSLKAIQEARA